MLVKNSILGGNTDLFPGGIIASSGSDVNFAYCDAINSGGSGPSWHVPMVKDGGGNIDAEPQFANTLNNDYHLKSAAGRWDPNSERWVRDSITSPCIDAGDPNSDWTAELWPHGKRINIGAYGGTAEASMSLSALGNIANLDNDPEEIVDIFDIAIFASQWCLRDMPLSADIDRNGRVDFLDFAALFHVFTVASNWWKFDEGTGTIAHDFAGTNNGTIYGATWTTGKIAGALSFNGTSNYVGCGSGASNYDNITVSAWMKTSANGVLVSNRYNSGSYGTWYTLSSTGIEIGDNSQGGYRSVTFNASTLNGLWHHIVYTKDGTSHAIYVDGSLDRSFTSNADISWSQPLYIGKRWNRTSNIGWFNGIIDDVRIYNRALSAGEVAQLYEEAN
jgi:hypothetical protein